MKNVVFDCEVITPMFLAGADGRTPELRPPSIKGMLRFWWRAMQGFDTIEEMHKEEGEIFGGTEEDVGRSKFSLRVIPTDLKISSDLNGLSQQIGDSGKYLYYSAVMLNKREFIEPGSRFKLRINFDNRLDAKKKLSVISAIWLWGVFGSLGTRSRRAAGNIHISHCEGADNFLIPNIETSAQLEAQLIQETRKIIPANSPQSYSTLKGAVIYLFNEPKKSWDAAVKALGAEYSSFRTKNKDKIYDTPNFGIPVMHRNPRTLFTASVLEERKLLERRASPLILRILKISDCCYFPLILHLGGKFLPDGSRIVEKNKRHNGKQPSKQILDNFFSTIEHKVRKRKL